ncbi:hypothetical protein INS49_012199 [Diaporthe citri]|uniref:uncharacterized protein n=1 Tax=Diaporthe citri TaxID=83186 RepID=UPI001C7FD4D5|nr:uncharacterized protein INS49_012199 [Diaporthe citri]KAG6358681.1 hypothetical protein INS49_012199 [Diaporthe citri]
MASSHGPWENPVEELPQRSTVPGNALTATERGCRESADISHGHQTHHQVDRAVKDLNLRSNIGDFVRFGKCVLYFTAAHVLLLDQNTVNQRQSQDGDLNDLAGCESDYFSEDDSAYESEDDDGFIDYSALSQQNSLPPAQAMTIRGPNSSCHSSSLSPKLELCCRPPQCDDASVIPSSSKAPNFINQVSFKSHELDFALRDLSNLETPTCNIPELKATTVSLIGAGSTEVVAYAGLRRNLKGRMSGRSSYIRFPYGGIYQEVYPVVFESGIQVGDSGIMVRDAGSGKIYGHIVVASIASRTAFIVPATKVLQEIPWLPPVASPIYIRLDYDSGRFRLVRLLPASSSDDGICCELSLACLRPTEIRSPVVRAAGARRPQADTSQWPAVECGNWYRSCVTETEVRKHR